MQCFIYRSSIKEGLYVYLASEDGLKSLPEPVLRQLGDAEFAMSVELHENRPLQQENVLEVIENLKNQGFHIQMPRDIESIVAGIARKTQLPQP